MELSLSYCGLIDAKIRTSDKDLPVLSYTLNFKDAKPEIKILTITHEYVGRSLKFD